MLVAGIIVEIAMLRCKLAVMGAGGVSDGLSKKERVAVKLILEHNRNAI